MLVLERLSTLILKQFQFPEDSVAYTKLKRILILERLTIRVS